VVDPDTVPVSASARAYLGAVIDMELIGRPEIARRGYASALRRWPGNLVALGGLGNSAYAMGDYAASEAAFREALEQAPDEAGMWNNLAYALAQQGQREASLSAVRKALELDPDNGDYRDSLVDLENRDWD
jgi:tetratricopeptide (TPR) repeat protein